MLPHKINANLANRKAFSHVMGMKRGYLISLLTIRHDQVLAFIGDSGMVIKVLGRMGKVLTVRFL